METIGALYSSSAPVNHHNSSHSQLLEWLQVTLADLNRRMGTMMTFLKEDGNWSSQTRNCYQRRQELIQMLQELNTCYRHLAEKFIALASNSCHVSDPGSISSSSGSKNKKSLLGMSDDPNFEHFDSHFQHIVADPHPDVKCHCTNFHIECLNKLAEELMSTEQCKMKVKTKLEIRNSHTDKKGTDFCNKEDKPMKMDDCDLAKAPEGMLQSYQTKNSQSELELQFIKLMEENLRQQTELARRNIEKKVAINRLQLQVENLKNENRALQDCISRLKVGERHNQFQISKPRGLFFGWLHLLSFPLESLSSLQTSSWQFRHELNIESNKWRQPL